MRNPLLVVAFLAIAAASQLVVAADSPPAAPPNLVIILADDLGYGDLGCYGHPTIRTPHLDRMAAEGVRFTDFYAGSSVCTPSRAALMTGRYAPRSGMASIRRRVLFPYSTSGLPESEITLAEAMKARGYATAAVGKWHLGHLPKYLPTHHGFDEYFGIPYSNDMRPSPLLDGEKQLEEPAVQETLTRRYTERAVDFIHRSKDKPFFLYFAHTFPHVPLHSAPPFKDSSPRGLYGDVVEELDASVGKVIKALQDEKIAERTLVVFTSDNGPWLIKQLNGGSAGLLREGKGSTWEGGQRVPGIFWWPGTIKPGVSHAVACNMDLFTTGVKLAGGEIPADRAIDGIDLMPLLLGKSTAGRDTFFFYRDDELWAVRIGKWKLHYVTRSAYGKDPAEKHDPPLLFNLEEDPSEQFDVAAKNPQVLMEIHKAVNAHKPTMKPVVNQLDLGTPPATRPATRPVTRAATRRAARVE
jgi:arylsulfatase A-like enzyme